MSRDYSARLQNLRERKFDPSLQQPMVAQAFSKIEIPENLRYLAECMEPIGHNYNQQTIDAANDVKDCLEKHFQLGFSRTYRYRGSPITKTNIRVNSDIVLLAIID